MSLTSGFYNSISGDRKYTATQISALFDGILNDGIFSTIGSGFAVSANTGMNINVGTGRAWFHRTWTDNDAIIPLTVDAAEVVLDRIDIVALEVNLTDEIRANSVKIVKGTPSSTPVAPTLTNADGVYQYPLAHIYVAAGVVEILTANITSKIGTLDCPYISGLMGSGQMLGSALTKVFSYNAQTLIEDITIAADQNSSAVGPVTIQDGVSLEISSGARLIIL